MDGPLSSTLACGGRSDVHQRIQIFEFVQGWFRDILSSTHHIRQSITAKCFANISCLVLG